MNLADHSIEAIPAAEDTERTILGVCLRESERIVELSSVLAPDDFWLDSHQRIYRAMLDMSDSHGVFDLVTLSQYMRDRSEIESVGGVAYLASLTEGLYDSCPIAEYARIVKDKALRRSILSFCERLKGRAVSGNVSALEIGAWAMSAMAQIVEEGASREDIFDAQTLADDSEYRLVDNPSEEPAISTGIRGLDEFTGGGIRLGELWIVGAAPSRGKTTLARQVVKAAVSVGISAYVHSGEMSKESWFDVTACLAAEIPAWKIRQPRLMNTSDRDRLREALRKLCRMPLYLGDTGGISLEKLIWNATRATRKNGVQIVAVDYAQIVHAPGRDPREQVTNVAQRLRRFAKDEGVAVILLSQSPRPEGRNVNAKPSMFSLKESGALEEAAHVVVLPYRPISSETGRFTGKDELIIGKNRWGALGSVSVRLNGEYLRFEEREHM